MDILKFSNLSKFDNLVHGISTKSFGSMKDEDVAPNSENISKFLSQMGLKTKGQYMHQVHGADVQIIVEKNKTEYFTADGMITDQKNIPLCVLVADCLPILFYDKSKKVIGIGHGGRRGLSAGIIKNILDIFRRVYKSRLQDIIIAIGPGIERNCYEVDGDLVDIKKLAIGLLINEGIMEKNIEIVDYCTKCNPDKFFSYRAGDKHDRFVASICIK
jgi:polyphenol oxidase